MSIYIDHFECTTVKTHQFSCFTKIDEVFISSPVFEVTPAVGLGAVGF